VSAWQTLHVTRQGPVGWLVFNRPEVGNAMDARMLRELELAWQELDADPEVRVIVNTGEGQAFQTGLDVKQLSRDREALREQSRRTKRAELRLTGWHNGIWKPIIVAVNGVCAGGGLHFVSDADIVVLSSTATLVDPHVSIGQVSAFETIGLSRKSPMEAVLRMALIGSQERIPAARALELGICSEVVEPRLLRPRAQALAELIAQRSPQLLRATKQALWHALEVGRSEALRGRLLALE
jgi:enoyl-CoA hydratase